MVGGGLLCWQCAFLTGTDRWRARETIPTHSGQLSGTKTWPITRHFLHLYHFSHLLLPRTTLSSTTHPYQSRTSLVCTLVIPMPPIYQSRTLLVCMVVIPMSFPHDRNWRNSWRELGPWFASNSRGTQRAMLLMVHMVYVSISFPLSFLFLFCLSHLLLWQQAWWASSLIPHC